MGLRSEFLRALDGANFFGTKYSGQIVFYFGLASLRIVFLPILWTTIPYVPILSPLYDQGYAWASSARTTHAIKVHILFGSIALVCAPLQFDSTLRRRNKPFHRVVGYIYIVSGFICIVHLQYLHHVVGAGKSCDWPSQRCEPSFAIQTMMDASSIIWLVAVVCAVWTVRRGEIAAHQRWMKRALAALTVPITQRIIDYGTTIALFPFLAAWMVLATSVRDRTLSPVTLWDESRFETGERILTFSGFGRTQVEVFGFSAWAGLLFNMVAVERSIALGGQALDGLGVLPPWAQRPLYRLLRADVEEVDAADADAREEADDDSVNESSCVEKGTESARAEKELAEEEDVALLGRA
jgi:uncharacterized membrane protein